MEKFAVVNANGVSRVVTSEEIKEQYIKKLISSNYD